MTLHLDLLSLSNNQISHVKAINVFVDTLDITPMEMYDIINVLLQCDNQQLY